MSPPYLRHSDVLPQGEHTALVEWTLANASQFAPSRLFGGRAEATVRVSRSAGDVRSVAGSLESRVLALAGDFMQTFGMGLTPGGLELELVAYGDGGRFLRHIDTAIGEAPPDATPRALSVVYYFHREPRGFTGGALRLYGLSERDGFVDIEPQQNSLVAFPSFVAHEVLPVACPSLEWAASRFAVNVWIHASAPVIDAGGAPAPGHSTQEGRSSGISRASGP